GRRCQATVPEVWGGCRNLACYSEAKRHDLLWCHRQVVPVGGRQWLGALSQEVRARGTLVRKSDSHLGVAARAGPIHEPYLYIAAVAAHALDDDILRRVEP